MNDETEINKTFHYFSKQRLKKSKYAELVKKYPDVFRQEESDTPMPYYLFGIECDDGWYSVMEKLVALIDYELQEDPKLKKEFRVLQIKEKYGGLRFYTTCENDAIFEAIQEAEEESYHVCELCGKEGKLRNSDNYGWMMTRCDECMSKEK